MLQGVELALLLEKELHSLHIWHHLYSLLWDNCTLGFLPRDRFL